MKTINYNIVVQAGTDDDAEWYYKEVSGKEAFEAYGFKFAVRETTDKGWVADEISTGGSIPISRQDTYAGAVSALKLYLQGKGEHEVRRAMAAAQIKLKELAAKGYLV